MISRQSDADFYCFTDDPEGIDPKVNVIEIDASEYQSWDNWWAAWWKIVLFVRPELEKYERKIFFDLDVIIHGNISQVLDFDSNFALVYSTWKGVPFKMKYPHKSLFNSSVIVWKDATSIYEYFMQNAGFAVHSRVLQYHSSHTSAARRSRDGPVGVWLS